ncbi:cobalt-precorrin-5B (C(1))-methyltransferase [Amphritea balenae]|uniref:Cobalt-precorrin-5B C(1)-methyltransferase n=1 Tax=Amphritea balenae TaxID=452629 RepID=A0A3P1SX78_9GAMM|nr:cobalt-precorrin-5B (C(1))-methyltransferase [Amphritea balenae]RRD00723.1 cobalt-precorrin-5B (C(1))-methyltransferase [Amphritea balenae]GGK68322.1 cobalt-precorrin-5B C(1)-methyltransferase [Amphritea balenae]
MWPESSESPQPLRSGLTTGCCATACCVAAVQALLKQRQPDKVEVHLPRGKTVELVIEGYHAIENGISASTIKDAGDDPDVTHGARVFVELRLVSNKGVSFKAAAGVGTVTREGLMLAVGEPAINPVPRKMMTEHLENAAYTYGYEGGFEVSVGIEKGDQIALKTMNPRLGILGGLSVLGTTGIVRPYSCAAYIASIHQGIDVARSNGIHHIAATTGSSSEAAIKAHYGLPEMALIEMGDFVGAVLKYLKKAPVNKLSICGGFGKLTKLANGHLDLNSRSSSIDFQHLALLAEQAGADRELSEWIKTANTSVQVLKACQLKGIDLAGIVCREALIKARSIVPEEVEVEIWAINRQGDFVGSASGETL